MRVLGVVSILALAFLLGSCGSRDASKAEKRDIDALHGDFVAALRRLHWSDSDAFETCVLEPETTLDEDPISWEALRAKLPDLERDTYDSFWSENERPQSIALLDRGAMKLHILARAEATELEASFYDDTRSDYWKIFRTRYGNAVRVGLSAPGLSQDRKQALIYYEASFDWLAAWGSYCLLRREGTRWEIATEWCVWQS